MIADGTTIDLNTRSPRPRPATPHSRRLGDTGWVLVAMPCVLLAGIGIGLLAWLMSSDGLATPLMSARLVADAIQYLLVVAVVTTATYIAVNQLRRAVAADHRAELARTIETHVAEPMRQVHAELARVKALAGGTSLHPEDPALLPGQRASGRAYASMALADGRIQSLADGQERLAGTVSEMGGELAKMRLLVEHAIARGAAGAPKRRRRAPNQRPAAAKSPTYSEGVLDGIRLANGEPAPEPDPDVRD